MIFVFTYVAYGLVTSSVLSFPNLKRVSATRSDVVIRRGSFDHPPRPQDSRVVATDAGIFLFWDDLLMAVLRGEEIVVDPIPVLDESTLRLVILGTAFGLLLRQRGQAVLHASSVDIDGHAVAFVGNTGCGKSSLALALLEQGHKLIADDVTALDLNGRRPVAISSFPQLGVEPDVAEAFSYDARLLDCVQPDFDKRAIPVKDQFLDGNRPLTHIFELDRGDSVTITRLGHSEAFLTLLRHSYRLAFVTIPAQAAHVSQLANVVKETPVFRITVPRSLVELPAVARRVAAFVKDPALTNEGD